MKHTISENKSRNDVNTDGGIRIGKHLIAVLIPVLWIVLIGSVTPLIPVFGGLDHDGQHYAVMQDDFLSNNPLARRAPYCWRIGVPLLASLFDFPPIPVFRILAATAHWIAMIQIFYLSRKLGLSLTGAFISQGLYAGMFWTIKFGFYSPCYIDWSILPVLIGVAQLLAGRRHYSAIALISAGVLFKESVLLVIPAAAVSIRGSTPEPAARIRRILFLCILPLAVFLAVRSLIVPANDYTLTGVITAGWNDVISARFWSRLPLELFSGTGVLALLCLDYRIANENLKRFPGAVPWIVAGGLGIFGGSDISRLLIPVLPPLIIAGSGVLASWITRRSFPGKLAFCAAAAFHLFAGHQFEPMRSYAAYLASMAPIHSQAGISLRGWILLVAAGLTGLITWRMSRRPKPDSKRAVAA
ncbi:hypothetical protein JXA40_04180 [bacterium]|nr:hypothetical protein [candidate division CSSED10-310 bacterium]